MKLLSQIKNDIDFNRNLYNLVDALGKIAVSQYYLLEKKVKLYEKIFTGVGEIFAAVDIVNSSSPFINPQNCPPRSEEHTSELQSQFHLVCRLLLEKAGHTHTVQPRLQCAPPRPSPPPGPVGS